MIKFRGIPLEDVSSIDGVNFDGKFVYGNYAKNGDGALIIGDVLEAEEDVFWPSWWVPVDPKTVEQFTGLQDKSGKDIYEGDAVQPVSSYINLKRGKPFEVKKGNYVYGKWIVKDMCYFSDEIQLIGNVHENPELLEAEK
ncbi:YopX family protein [Lactiplantibacillus plantarum]|uniref:YopX family protein n=1 Tax=Lactiplantibacillus plantarum TaxID=1590 RepID=UPI0005E229D3|nr:YopX family protein [Lactiplantibacillus plantarum]CDN29004.1 prophage Lp2 protein 26 [Lactiplantibacillus plantarum]